MGLGLFYLISVIGIAMNMHYCSGKLSSVRFIEPAKCSACKKEDKLAKTHNCCKTTEVEVKVKDSHQGGIKVKLPENFSLQLFHYTGVSNLFGPVFKRFSHTLENKAPPRSAVIALHLYNCVFRN